MEDLSELYERHQRLLFKYARSFQRTCGGDLDDWIGEAHLGFVKAAETYNPGTAKITTWISFVVQNRLRDYARKQKRWRLVEWDASFHEPHQPKQEFRLDDFLTELPEDARTIVNMIFQTPCELARLIGPDMRMYRGVLRRFFMMCGWENDRVNDAYKAVRENLG